MLLAALMVISLAACNPVNPTDKPTDKATDKATDAPTEAQTEDDAEGSYINGMYYFKETREITVEVFDRNVDNGTPANDNKFTDWIKAGVLRDHNIKVEFVAVPRWTETDEINNLLAAGDAPDICYTYSYPTILQYASQDGVIDLAELVEDKEMFPNLWSWLKESNIYWDKSVTDGSLYALEGRRANSNRIVTFIRQDWLDALKLDVPTTKAEFEACLVAFRDNAATLLGENADKMVPYSVSYDVGWRAGTLIESFIDPDITDKEFYINGFDDRKYTENGTKEAIRLLNKWYNMGLLWDDFALYGPGDTTEDDMMKAGYVGALTHNWDYVFRNGEDSINYQLTINVGENAKFVPCDPFEDANGTHQKFVDSGAGDRKAFLPYTNEEPIASLLYLDWISTASNILYLQTGEEGVNHIKGDDGSYKIISALGTEWAQNSGQNIDLTMTCNGLNLGDANITALSTAYSYPNNDPALVAAADAIAKTDTIPAKNVKVATIESENGMGEVLKTARDEGFDKSVVCAVADFDKTWDQYMASYLAQGGQDIIDERTVAWEAVYSGDSLQ